MSFRKAQLRVRRPGEFTCKEHDRQGNHGLDGRRGHDDPSERRRNQRQGVRNSEGGDRTNQAPRVRYEEEQRENEQQMIDAKQNMMHAETDVGGHNFGAGRNTGQARRGRVAGQTQSARLARCEFEPHEYVGNGLLQAIHGHRAVGNAAWTDHAPDGHPRSPVESRSAPIARAAIFRQAHPDRHGPPVHIRHTPRHAPGLVRLGRKIQKPWLQRVCACVRTASGDADGGHDHGENDSHCAVHDAGRRALRLVHGRSIWVRSIRYRAFMA